MDLREIGWGVWSGFTWLRIGTIGSLLWMQWWTFGFWRHGVSWFVVVWVGKGLYTCMFIYVIHMQTEQTGDINRFINLHSKTHDYF
jgi:hypothetical protein